VSSSVSKNKADLFPDTRWSIVLNAQGLANDAKVSRALADLCQAYWYPLYVYARKAGLSPQDSEDRTQEFFQKLLSRRSLDKASPAGGKLRAYLQASMRNFLNDRWRHDLAQKRGGSAVHISIDQEWAEARLSEEPDSAELFDRTWALSILRSVFVRLDAYFERIGKMDLYEAIKGCLQGDGTYSSAKEIAGRLGISEEGVRSAVFKLRRRFRDFIHDEIRETCTGETEVKEELAYLCKILSRHG
jgi:RNA polymerase sigma factor (sigma-70 family)